MRIIRGQLSLFDSMDLLGEDTREELMETLEYRVALSSDMDEGRSGPRVTMMPVYANPNDDPDGDNPDWDGREPDERLATLVTDRWKQPAGSDALLLIERDAQDMDQEIHVLCGHAKFKKDCRGCRLGRSTQAQAKRGSAQPGSGADEGEQVFHCDLRGPYETSHAGAGRLLCVCRTDVLPPTSPEVEARLQNASFREILRKKLEKHGLEEQIDGRSTLDDIIMLAGLDTYDEDWTLDMALYFLLDDDEVSTWVQDIISDLFRRDALFCVPCPRKDDDCLIFAFSRVLYEMSDSPEDRARPAVFHMDGEQSVFRSDACKAYVASREGRFHKSLPGRHCAVAENTVRRISELAICGLEESCVDSRFWDVIAQTVCCYRNEALNQRSRRLNVATRVKIGVLGYINLPLHVVHRIKSAPRVVVGVFIGLDLLTRVGVVIEFYDPGLQKLRYTTVHQDSASWSDQYAYGWQRQGIRLLRCAREELAEGDDKPEYNEDQLKDDWVFCNGCGRSRRVPAFVDVQVYQGPFLCPELDYCDWNCSMPQQPVGLRELEEGQALAEAIIDYDAGNHLYLVRWEGGDETWETRETLGSDLDGWMTTARNRARVHKAVIDDEDLQFELDFVDSAEFRHNLSKCDGPKVQFLRVFITKSVGRATADRDYSYLNWDAAFLKEVKNLCTYKAFGFPLKSKPHSGPNDTEHTFTWIVAVRAVKHADLDKSLQVAKVRGVIFGCDIRDEVGEQAVFTRMYDQPATMVEVRVFVVTCMLNGFPILQFDVESAYLNAVLKEPCFVQVRDPRFEKAMLVEFGLDESWMRSWWPVEKAIYGHPQAGFTWAELMANLLIEFGMVKDTDVTGAFYVLRPKNVEGGTGPRVTMCVVIFADDGLIGGKSAEVRRLRAFLDNKLTVKTSDFTRFLGGDYQYNLGVDGMHTCTLDISSYVEHSAERFTSEVDANRHPPLSKKKIDTPGVEVASIEDTTGVHKLTCRSHIGSLLFGSRLGLPGLIYYVGSLARYVDKWTTVEDRLLRRVYQYLIQYSKEALVMHVAQRDLKEKDSLFVAIFTDADHGGDRRDRKSTSSCYVFLLGKHGTCCLMEFRSQGQKVTSTSTAESELVAATSSAKIGMLVVMLLEVSLGISLPIKLLVDSQCALSIIAAGYSKTLRYMKKTHGVCISWLHEVCAELMEADYVRSSENVSDLGTKALPGHTQRRLERFCGMRSHSELGKARCSCECLSPHWDGTRVRCLEPATIGRFCKACAKGCACRCWFAGAEEPAPK